MTTSTITLRPLRRSAIALMAAMAVACAPNVDKPSREVVVAATDYAFTLPDTLTPGPIAFRMKNDGRVPHEMAMARLRHGVTADSLLSAMAAGGDPEKFTDGLVGILIVEPGATSIGSLNTDLVSGRTYVLICQFKDADSLPPHIAMGMQASFVVD